MTHKQRVLLLILLGLFLLSWLTAEQVAVSSTYLQAPSSTHWFGTNALGQDVAALVWQAFPNSLLIAFLAGSLPVVWAAILATFVYLSPRWVDQLVLKCVDLLLVLPGTLLLLLFASWLEPSLWGSIFLVALVSWMDDFRILRMALIKAALRDHLMVARSFGAKPGYLILQHLWPSLGSLLFALWLQNARRGLLLTAGLAFLGLLDPRQQHWGSMLFVAQSHIDIDAFWWLMLPPAFALTSLIFLFALLQPRVSFDATTTA